MEIIYNEIHSAIFTDNHDIYAVLDAASIPNLLKKLYSKLYAHKCLYHGDLSIGMMDVAPFVVPLKPHSDLTKWVINDGWGKHWGIFVCVETGTSNLKSITEHFRQFMIIQGPDNESVYFRFYDPRVLNIYLPIFDQNQLDTMYGHNIAYYVAEDIYSNIVHFKYESHGIEVEKTELTKRKIEKNALLLKQ